MEGSNYPSIFLPGNFPGLNVDPINAHEIEPNLSLNIISDIYEDEYYQKGIFFNFRFNLFRLFDESPCAVFFAFY